MEISHENVKHSVKDSSESSKLIIDTTIAAVDAVATITIVTGTQTINAFGIYDTLRIIDTRAYVWKKENVALRYLLLARN